MGVLRDIFSMRSAQPFNGVEATPSVSARCASNRTKPGDTMVVWANSLYKAAPAYYQPPRLKPALPAVVGECLVGLGHAVSIFALADGGAAILGGFHQLGGKTVRHGLFAASGRRFDDPAHRQRLTPIGTNFDG